MRRARIARPARVATRDVLIVGGAVAVASNHSKKTAPVATPVVVNNITVKEDKDEKEDK